MRTLAPKKATRFYKKKKSLKFPTTKNFELYISIWDGSA